MTEDLHAILQTIREVEASLDRRQMRAEATLLMIWGVVGASIMAFYQLVMWNHDAWHAALGPALDWVWVGPMVVGYVASALVGARLGRVGDAEGRRRSLRRSGGTAGVIALLVVVLVLTGRYDLVYGAITVVSGGVLVLFAWGGQRTRVRTTAIAIGATMAAVGLALLAWSTSAYAPGIASLSVLVGYLTLGTVKYRAGA